MNYGVYWGDLHSHCAVSYGRGTLDRALRAAREHLDFCSVTGHATWPDMPDDRGRYGEVIDYHLEGFARLRRNWPQVQRAVEAFHEPGRFVPILSYEWHSLAFGDHNVYYPGDRGPIIEREDLDALQAALPKDALLIPHHIGYGPGARGIDWSAFDEGRSPVVEMFSSHGGSERDGGPYPIHHTMGPRVLEGTVAHGLALGKRFGLIGSSDHHGGYPGHYGAGRTAVLATELTREAIWDALRARRCYAVTGDKIRLDARLNGFPMGAEAATATVREIDVDVYGCDALDRIEIIKNGRPLHRAFGPVAPSSPAGEGVFKVRLEWGWGEKNVLVSWRGQVALEGAELLSLERTFRGEEVLDPRDDRTGAPEEELLHGVTRWDAGGAEWFSTTFGNPHPLVAGTSGLILEVRAERNAVLHFEVNGRPFSYALADLVEGSRREAMRGWLSEVFQIHRAVPEVQLRTHLRVRDEPERDVDHYYVRVAQENGQWAWSSPIWVRQ